MTDSPWTMPLVFLAAYLAGGVPMSYLVVRAAKGVDLRQIGSGNVGATNASRLFPKPLSFGVFVLCFALDALKGGLPAWLLAPWLGQGFLSEWDPSSRILLVGLFAILGHIYTPYLGFRGGKGVATATGVFIAAAPAAMIAALLIGIAVIFTTRYVSLGSIAIGVALPAILWLRRPESVALCVMATLVGGFIIFAHRSNIARLVRGEENRLFQSKSDYSK